MLVVFKSHSGVGNHLAQELAALGFLDWSHAHRFAAGAGHTKGIASKTSENMIGRSRVRTLHCLQHRLGSGSHGEDVLQQPQWLFVGQGCLQTLLRNGSLELSHSGCRESKEVTLPLPGIRA